MARFLSAIWLLFVVGVVCGHKKADKMDAVMRRLEAAENEITKLKGEKCSSGTEKREIISLPKILSYVTGAGVSGSVYTRWGKTECGDKAELIYKGITVGPYFATNSGGGANHLCMPDSPPEYNKYKEGASYVTKISGTEYSSGSIGIFPNDAHQKNVPCARCYTKRAAHMMMPGKRTCPKGWTMEYEGYLMTEYDQGQNDRSMYECIDASPEYVAGSSAHTRGSLLHFVKPDCSGNGNTFLCPPYNAERQLTCVICTK